MMARLVMGLAVALCPAGDARADCSLAVAGWQRTGSPVFRDPIANEAYEVAGDPHVFAEGGRVFMAYSGDDMGEIATKLAERKDGHWHRVGTLLGLSQGHETPRMKETPFYLRTPEGGHHLYIIGYNDGDLYDSEVYRAVAPSVEGPWTLDPVPVIRRGEMAGRRVEVITSPSVVAWDGQLWMTFLAWDGFEDVTAVWVMGARSVDGGATWSAPEEVEVPIGMEGQIAARPGGGFVAARTGSTETDGIEAIWIACADRPFGPYTEAATPALVQAGPPWETDEIIAPHVFFDPETGAPSLFYAGADHATGWWIMEARPGG